MENVIYDIYTRVNSKLQLNSNETLDAMLVASDVTQLSRTEQIRSEFIANASHELKSPITSIRGFKERTGDCFTYYAMLKAMVTSQGYETIDVQRVEGYETHHYWSLIKWRDNWYHIDSCPRSEEHMKYWYCFLRTDAELAWFNNQVGEGYYDYDESLYPRTPEQKLNTGRDIDGDY